MATFDLKQVGKLFDDTITAIRVETPDMAALEPQAIEWLKAARYRLMRDIEEAYYKLQSSRHEPLLQPAWAVDPSQTLFLMTNEIPRVLHPFRGAIGDNLFTLLKECGFQHSTRSDDDRGIYFWIRFPARVTAPKTAPRTLYIEDEFSRRAEEEGGAKSSNDGGGFAASDFGRLLIDARGESAGGGSSSDSPEEDEAAPGAPNSEGGVE
ncbi:hypothetical protein B0H19DRAFT_1079965 [Mycena capillaripes]|nr:hypothetical protein B0H19DRAFT_1079965 [Mycena capillaripes]